MSNRAGEPAYLIASAIKARNPTLFRKMSEDGGMTCGHGKRYSDETIQEINAWVQTQDDLRGLK